MPNTSPDWVRAVQVAVTISNVPVIPEAANEYPIDSYGEVTTASATYVTVKTWTVTAERIGKLRSIEIACTDYDITQWKLVVATVIVFEDVSIPTSFTKEWPDLELAPAAVVTLSVKSNGSQSITAYADFNAKEVG